MKKYMDFIEKYSVEKRFYCRLFDVYRKNEWEVSWKRNDDKEKSWAFKSVNDVQWTYYSSAELIKILGHSKIDVFGFEAELQCKIKNMIVFASLMQKEAKKLMGNDIVESSMAEYDEFANSLMETIKQLLPDSKVDPNIEADKGVLNHKKQPSLKLVTPNKN
ncbi:MAG: hypothetical protein HRU09_09100 [Oligoflexales bacterium]|nr:hypothetical protein [Oligoflexales bacterium]